MSEGKCNKINNLSTNRRLTYAYQTSRSFLCQSCTASPKNRFVLIRLLGRQGIGALGRTRRRQGKKPAETTSSVEMHTCAAPVQEEASAVQSKVLVSNSRPPRCVMTTLLGITDVRLVNSKTLTSNESKANNTYLARTILPCGTKA